MAKMRFKENKYLHDRNVPYFEAGKIYEVAKENVERWLKRGGTLIDEEAAELKAKAKAAKAAPVVVKADTPPEKVEEVPLPTPKVEGIDEDILGVSDEELEDEVEKAEDQSNEKSAPSTKRTYQQHGKGKYNRR